MAETLKSVISVSAVMENQNTLDLSVVKAPLNFKKTLTLLNGVGLDQNDLIFHDQRTLAASATENLDLAGSLTNAFGTTLTFVKIKGMIFTAALANTNNVQVGGAAANAFVNWVADATDIINIAPNGVFLHLNPTLAGWAVTAGTGDLLKITNSGGGTSVTYDVILIGTSA